MFFKSVYRIILGLFVLAMCMADANAQSTPKYSNEFLNIGVGARAFGMSNSVVATTSGVTAGYWNPAALVHQEDRLQLGFMHSAYLAGISNYDYLALGAKVKDNAAIGFSMVRFGVDGIPNTFDLIRNGQIDYDRVTEFSAIDYAFIFSYAQKTAVKGLSIGGSAKIINRRAGEFTTAWGFGIDASLLYKAKNQWSFAVMGRDITSTFNAWNFNFTDDEKDIFTQTDNEIPINSLEITLPRIILGAAKRFDINEEIGLTSELNLDITTDGRRNSLISSSVISGDPHLGIEADYLKVIFLRGGLGNFQTVLSEDGVDQWTFQPNVGVGLHLKNITIDYALSDIGDQSAALYSHVFSIKAAINPQGAN